MYLVFDTETNGKIKNWNIGLSDLDNFPRVTQLAFALYREDGSIKVKHSFLIKPDGWEIPTEKFFIDNNTSTERCQELGIPIFEALNQFIECIEDAQVLIAHNIAFDHPILCAEMMRIGMKAGRKLDKVCTMKSSTDYCKLPGRYGYKFPKLEELHMKLFGSMPKDMAHDALGDVLTTAKCFFELKKLNLI